MKPPRRKPPQPENNFPPSTTNTAGNPNTRTRAPHHAHVKPSHPRAKPPHPKAGKFNKGKRP
jgi:hypothetical protein